MGVKLSVAMTTYNGAKYVIDQLDSIRMQTLAVDEVVIRDDRSSDNTVELIDDYIRTHGLHSWSVTVNEVNMGFADNFIQAIRACQGDLVFLSDQDDIWYECKVEETLNFMRKNPDIDCVASAYQTCDSEGMPADINLRDNRKGDDGTTEPIGLRYFADGLTVRGASMCFRKSILKDEPVYRIGTFGHDTLLGIYSIIKGKMVFYNKILFKYRIHDSNTSGVTLSKDAKFSAKRLNKRLEVLGDDISVMLRLVEREDLNRFSKKMMLQRLRFAKMRADLIHEISGVNTFRSMLFIGNYMRASQYGVIGGCYTLLTDILFGVKYRKQKRAR